MILLDGLDEVQERRTFLANKVETFAAEVVEKGNKLLVTSRIVGYREAPLSSKWTLCTLLDFDREAIANFAQKWCLAFEKSISGITHEASVAAEKERQALLQAVDANAGVRQLATNPLLLTILALIKRQGVTLPNRRVELYELYLQTLIRSWNKTRALDRHPVGPDSNYNEVLHTLAPLALWLRQENPTAGVVPEDALLSQLTRHYMGEDWNLSRGPAFEKAQDFLEGVRRYSNLLVERGAHLYGFLHLTFEEMLAAYGIYLLGQLGYQTSLPIIRDHLTDPGWRETILLAVGVWGLANKQPKVAGEVVRAMLQMPCEHEECGQNVLVAGACLEDVGAEGIGRAAANEVIDALENLALDRSLPPYTQRDAGFILGRLAGNNAEFLARIRPDLDDFINIPAGEFRYGEHKRKASIEKPYAIGKYLVTNLQYRRFLEDKGYERKEFWSEQGWSWRSGEWDTNADDKLKQYLALREVNKRNQPYTWQDAKWNNPLAPVVGVCWFEAQAYCNWLSRQKNQPARLPSELEWERAARGSTGREYAWGDDFDRNKLNAAAFWAQIDDAEYSSMIADYITTTLVGQFPAGSTPEGIADMSGNVNEWTDTCLEKQRENRALRGGSWGYNRKLCRCAILDGIIPIRFGNGLGFRVILPGSDSES